MARQGRKRFLLGVGDVPLEGGKGERAIDKGGEEDFSILKTTYGKGLSILDS